MAMFLNTPLPYKRYKKISETTYFVDKSLILNDIFGCMEEETQYICITRPRRFGKTIMANMLGAFFGKAWDASQIFDHLKIADSPEYHQYLNQYDIIYIDFSRLPENQQDRKIAVSAIKHLDQSKKRKNILIAVVSLFKENWLYEKFSLFYLEIRYIIFKYRWD
jgi:hypothetical protein